jgi:3-oxoacyl-[acyl-carrier protein] reductase
MSGLDFTGKVILVTGGSRGIGRACAVAFARAGGTVVLTYAGNDAAAEEAVRLAGPRARAVKFDVADTVACARCVEQLVAADGRLDVLVNNAGLAVDGLAVRVKDEDWDRQLDTNLKGAFALARAAARPMMKQRSGAVVNLVSVVGETGNVGQAAYAASKAGLVGLTKALARELASRNVRVNAVSPGFIDTDMTSKISADMRQRLLDSIPLGRLGTADEVAWAVLFLASDAASYTTGTVLKVNGGMYM